MVEQQTSTPQYVVGPAALADVPRLYLALEEFLTFSNSVEGCTLLAQLRQDPRGLRDSVWVQSRNIRRSECFYANRYGVGLGHDVPPRTFLTTSL